MPEIVSIGECFVELSSSRPISAASSFDMSFSGDSLNVLAMASKFGSSCGYVTRVSDDPLGDFLIDSWRALGIDTSFVRQVRGFNAFEFYSPKPVGEGTSLHYRRGSAASTMVPEDLDPEYIGRAKVLHISGITHGLSTTCRRTVLEAVKMGRERGAIVSYDANLRPRLWTVGEARGAMDEVLPDIDIIFIGHPKESKLLVGLDSESEVIDFFISRGVRRVALMCGEEGAWLGTADGVARATAIAPLGVVDTTSAGDTFAGAFLHCVTEEQDPLESLRWAVAAAGLKVGGLSITGQPTREQVERNLDSVQVHSV